PERPEAAARRVGAKVAGSRADRGSADCPQDSLGDILQAHTTESEVRLFPRRPHAAACVAGAGAPAGVREPDRSEAARRAVPPQPGAIPPPLRSPDGR